MSNFNSIVDSCFIIGLGLAGCGGALIDLQIVKRNGELWKWKSMFYPLRWINFFKENWIDVKVPFGFCF